MKKIKIATLFLAAGAFLFTPLHSYAETQQPNRVIVYKAKPSALESIKDDEDRKESIGSVATAHSQGSKSVKAKRQIPSEPLNRDDAGDSQSNNDDGHNASLEDDYLAELQPEGRDSKVPIKFISWMNLDMVGVTPMTWAKASGNGPNLWNAYVDPVVLAEETAPRLMERPEGQRFLFLRHFGQLCPLGTDPAFKCSVVAGISGLDSIFPAIRLMSTEGYRINKIYDLQWLEDFFGTLARLNVKPDYIILENEQGVNYWHIKNSVEARFGSDFQTISEAMEDTFETIFEQNNDVLPSTVTSFTPTDFRSHVQPNGGAAITAWNEYAKRLKNETLRYLMTSSLTSAYGPEAKNIPYSNYKDHEAGTPYYTKHGWRINPHKGSRSGSHASPDLYMTFGNRTIINGELQWDVALQDMLDSIDSNVLGMNGDGTKVAPWVTMWAGLTGVSGTHRNMIAEMNEIIIRHAHSNGVKTFILFEPNALSPTRHQKLQDLILDLRDRAANDSQGSTDHTGLQNQ